MGKGRLYQRLKGSWRHWDEDVYKLAVVMSKAFETVIGSAEADAEMVAELKHMHAEMKQYEAWRDKSKTA